MVPLSTRHCTKNLSQFSAPSLGTIYIVPIIVSVIATTKRNRDHVSLEAVVIDVINFQSLCVLEYNHYTTRTYYPLRRIPSYPLCATSELPDAYHRKPQLH